MENIKNNENQELCSKCGGKCCKAYAGAYHPDDFNHELTDAWLEDLVQGNQTYPNGKPILVSIDWAEGVKGAPDGRGYFLRPRHIDIDGEIGGIVDPSWGAECYHLTATGCDLPFDERPYRCRLKEPSKCFEKKDEFAEKNESMELWSPYWKKLHQLCFKYNDGTFTGRKDPLASLIDAIFGGI
jgi:hypothetical protein